MGIEIERKFLVKNQGWRSLAVGTPYRQGYIANSEGRTVRVRQVGNQGYLTIKGPSQANSRAEFEYLIPLEDAQFMLDNLCNPPLIEKQRYKIQEGQLLWEVDEFFGENQGLIVAEVELTDENQAVELPEWIGQEVSDDPRYFNVNLSTYPYSQWTEGNSM
jgi:adenylate cyclase